MWRVRVGTDTGIRIRNAVARLNYRRHFFQIDLMHDAVTRWNHVDVVERRFSPLDEVKAVSITTLFNVTVFLECIRIKAATLNSQRVVNNQLRLNHWIHFGRITALSCDCITQASQIHQSGLTQNIVSHNACWVPGKVEIALTVDQLLQACVQCFWRTTADQLLCQNTRGVWQCVV